MKDFFNQINILYLALFMGQVLFCAVVIVLGMTGDAAPEAANLLNAEMFDLLVPILMITALGCVYFINKKRKADGAALESLAAKAAHYRSTFIIRSAILEGSNLFTVVVMLLVSYESYLFYFIIGLTAFLYYRPSVEKFITEYQINAKEESELKSDLI